jgi:hypothetical protein
MRLNKNRKLVEDGEVVSKGCDVYSVTKVVNTAMAGLV